MTQRLTIVGEVSPHIGYGQHIIAITRALDQLGVWCSIRALRSREVFGAQVPQDIRERFVSGPQPEPTELIISPPHVRPTPGKRTIYWTMWESTRVPEDCVANLNLADIVVVPSRWCRDSFMDSGVQTPIEVVHLGIDEAFRLQPWPEKKIFTFGCAGRTQHGRERKGLDAVVRAFLAAFPYDDGVQLWLKCHPDCQLPDIQDARIKVNRNHISNEEIAVWLGGLHCFVTAACAEGFGFWPLQAMACGRPVIGPLYGGLREFMTEQNSFPVGYREIGSSEGFGGKWAAPDLGYMMEQMKFVRCHESRVIERGLVASAVGNGFSWGIAAHAIKRIVTHESFSVRGVDEQDSVIKQAMRNGWPVTRFRFEQDKDESVFNPSVVSDGTGLLWFARRSTVRAGKILDSEIFAFAERDIITKKDRFYIKLPGLVGDGFEDPRVSVDGERLMMSFTRVRKGKKPCHEVVWMDEDMTVLDIQHVDHGGNGRSASTSRLTEKNWAWFRHDGDLHFVYWIEPMTVVRVHDGEAVEVHKTSKRLETWRYGVRHGGSHPVRIGDEYFGFCHSHLPWFGPSAVRYFASAYAFSAKPPFGLTRLSRRPFLYGEDDWSGNPISCVIVGGAVLEAGVWTLAVGARDTQCLKIKIPHQEILNEMETL